MRTKQLKRELQASEIMTKSIQMVSGRDSVAYVAGLFTEHFIGAAAVTDEKGQPVGVITKTDLVRYQEERNGATKSQETAANWMTGVIFSVKPETSIKEIASRMVRYGIHHIFVKKPRETSLLGIVSSFDVLRAIAK